MSVKLNYPSLVLGLGGTGFLCVSELKREIREFFGEIPDGIKFLVIDSGLAKDNQSEYKKIFQKNSLIKASGKMSDEWIKLSTDKADELGKYISEPGDKADIRFFEMDDSKRKELMEEVGSFNIVQGAGQKRIIGKTALAYPPNFKIVKEKLISMLSPLSTPNVKGVENYTYITVLIVNSLAGGSGAGTFLDLQFILQNLTGVNKERYVMTFNIMPDIFLGLNNVFEHLVIPNAFAAISEMDYIYNNFIEFTPTNQKEAINSQEILPKANFLINQQVFNGSKISFESMIKTTSKSMFNLLLSNNNYFFQASNFDKQISSKIKGKKKIFSSVGYAEIVFNFDKLKSHTVKKILNRSWNEFKSKRSNDESGISEGINNFVENYSENLLSHSTNGKDFETSLKEIVYDKPLISKRTHARLKSLITQNKEKMKSDILHLTRQSYDKYAISNLIKRVVDDIKVSNYEKTDIDDQLNKLKEELRTLHIDINKKANDENIIKDFERKFQEQYSSVEGVPRRYKGIFGFGIKKEFFTKHLSLIIKDIEGMCNSEYKYIILMNDIYRLIANDIFLCMNAINNDSSNTDKLEWISRNLSQTPLPINSDNYIYLEAYFQDRIDQLVAASRDINRTLIEKYLAMDISFIDLVKDTTTMQFLCELESKDIYGLKDMLEQEQVDDIVKRINEVINPLWDRANDNEINSGGTDGAGNLIIVERVDVPPYQGEDPKAGEYFGKDTFNISSNNVYPNNSKHRQSFNKMELGLPAFHVKSLEKYKKVFDESIKDNDDLSVLYFAYDEIRKKVINGEAGIFVYEDREDERKKDLAMKTWALGWAAGLFFIDANRVKAQVSDEFIPEHDKRHLLAHRVYDLYHGERSNNLLQLFNKFKEEKALIIDIKNQTDSYREKEGNEKYLKLFENKFDRTSHTDFINKFRTEKKSYKNLEENERFFLDDEEKILKEIVQEIGDRYNVPYQFFEEKINGMGITRLRIGNNGH